METLIADKTDRYMFMNREDDKPFFGLYLNQARLNAYITLREISERVGEATTNEDSLAEMPVLELLDGGDDLIKRQRVQEFIEEHFPMLEVIYGVGQKTDAGNRQLEERGREYKKILKTMFRILNAKRNEYCHFMSGSGKLKDEDLRKLPGYLYKCFDAAVDGIKNRKGFKDTEVEHLIRKTSEGWGKNKRSVDKPDFAYKLVDEKGMFMQHGLAFFTTLFLSRKDSHLFLKKQERFKRSEQACERATLECFCELHIRVPKPVVKSDDDENGLALDMLNELKRCPKELYEIISKDNREKFLTEDDEGNEVLLMRYNDRFAAFTLRFCDDMGVFDALRFQIDLGKYYFKFYDKDTIDGQQRKRSLDRRLKTFGRLKEVRNMVDEQWKDLIKSPNELNREENEPFKAASTPHYHIVDNNIKFTVSGDHGLPPLDEKGGSVRAKTEGWLSVYELPAMIFYGLMKGFKHVELELTKYIGKQQGICERVEACGLISADADKYIKARFEVKGSSKYRKEKLERLIADSEKLLSKLAGDIERNRDNKPGKKNFVDIKAGRLADFLARDILSMQAFEPEREGKDKITSLNFQVLQSSLAYYGAKKDEMEAIFRRAGVVGGGNPHPFLERLRPRNYGSIVNFYSAYLNEKIEFLKKCEEEGCLDHQFLRPTRGAYSESRIDVKTRAGEFIDKPVNIPKGFFAEKIRECVGKAVELPEKANCAYMIMQHFCTDDKHQEFYDYLRTYPIVEKAQNYRKINRVNGNLIPIFTAGSDYADMDRLIRGIPGEAKFKPDNLKGNLMKMCADVKNTERLLRRYKVQDMVTMMMINRILEKTIAGSGELKLKLEDIKPEPDSKSEFKKPIECSIDVRMPFYTAEGHPDSNYVKFIKEAGNIEYKPEENGRKITVEYKIKSEQAKLKDVGKYRRYLHDRRLPGLLLWKGLCEGKIEAGAIEEELGAYEQKRLEIAKMIYEIEKSVLRGRARTEKHMPFNEVVTSIMKDRLEKECVTEDAGEINNSEHLHIICCRLLSIRNALYHNQYPVRCGYIDSRDGELIADKMLEAAREIVGAIMK